MEFSQNKPIYLQIVDGFYEGILSGSLKEEDRVLSVREKAAELGVNPNTVMRSYEKMTADGIIYNKRGIGYFVSQGARAMVLDAEKRLFLEEEWPKLRRRMEVLGISVEELIG